MATSSKPTRNDPQLPPAGHKRTEELKRREASLNEQAEQEMNQVERHAIDPEKLKLDNEIQQHFDEFNELAVTNPDPSYVYCWTNAGYNGLFVKLKMAEHWEVVQGDMEEAREHRGIAADTTRRVGDVILMRIRKDYYKRLLRQRQAKAERNLNGITSNLQDLAHKYRDTGVKVKMIEDGTMDDRTLDTMAKRAQAQSTAQRMQDKWLREGTMPGMPAPGTGVENE